MLLGFLSLCLINEQLTLRDLRGYFWMQILFLQLIFCASLLISIPSSLYWNGLLLECPWTLYLANQGCVQRHLDLD